MAEHTPPQAMFFYKEPWIPEVDSLFLSTIVRKKKANHWSGCVIPRNVLKEASLVIYEELECCLEWDALYDRLQFMESRYRRFKEVLAHPCTHWNVHTNDMHNSEDKHKLAKTYFYHGEPEFNRLSYFYGPETVKIEDSKTVVVISDTIPVGPDEDQRGSGDQTNIEVTSPNMGATYNVRCKLFETECQNSDRESTNDRGNYYYKLGPDGELKKVFGQIYLKMVAPKTTPPYQSPHGSSCASSSPMKWWKSP